MSMISWQMETVKPGIHSMESNLDKFSFPLIFFLKRPLMEMVSKMVKMLAWQTRVKMTKRNLVLLGLD